MKHFLFILACGAVLGGFTHPCVAQTTGPSSTGIAPNKPDPARQPALMVVLDTNRDGSLSSNEINEAIVALRKLDLNNDGQLDPKELRAIQTPSRPSSEIPLPPPEVPQYSAFTRLIMESDKNKDGKVTKSELPEQMQRIFETADTNKDGVITLEEAERLGNPDKRPSRKAPR
jgi:Ca2+-binding EF-hand superfamily protein